MNLSQQEPEVVKSTQHTEEEWGSMYVGKRLVEYPKDMKPEQVKADAEPKMDDAEPEDRGPTVDEPTDEESSTDEESVDDEAKKEDKKKKQQVKWAELPQSVRVIWPNTRVTRDLRPNRLNVMCDADDKITKVQFF
ncbi:hypothetical protein GGI09_004973 [Coemansia sp. S100]|nr:hypothetical protein LPJ71_002264 [Coemansia sp. S17]KAJ2095237.1 hypothetical protein GGI09_004973 [Coemansia sp. S100]